MTSLLLKKDEDFADIDFIFEEIRSKAFDLHECIEHCKKLLGGTTKQTKAHQFYFTLWSTLVAQQLLMNEMRSYQEQVKRDNIRLQTLERLLLMVLKRDADLSGEEITFKIIDALAEKQN